MEILTICIPFVIFLTYTTLNQAAVNIAFGKSSMLSTTRSDHSGSDWVPEYAVDGISDERDVNNSFICAHSTLKSQQWWAVDLGDVYRVSHILIYGRSTPCCGRHLQNFDVDVIMPPACLCDKWVTFHDGKINYNYYEPSQTTFLNLTCPQNTFGRFVRIKKRGDLSLVVCEVEVYGELFPLVNPPTVNACGFIGKSYNGTVIKHTVAESKLECVMFCKTTESCCAAEFEESAKICTLDFKSNMPKNPIYSVYNDTGKITFFV